MQFHTVGYFADNEHVIKSDVTNRKECMNKNFTPMENRETLVYLGRSGGFDLRGCPDAEDLAKFIVTACNAHDKMVAVKNAALAYLVALDGWENTNKAERRVKDAENALRGAVHAAGAV